MCSMFLTRHKERQAHCRDSDHRHKEGMHSFDLKEMTVYNDSLKLKDTILSYYFFYVYVFIPSRFGDALKLFIELERQHSSL